MEGCPSPVYGDGLENRCALGVPWVRIPPPPPIKSIDNL